MSAYFDSLNYGLANEDTWVEYGLAPENAQSFFSVCGSGSRVTPLLAKNPQNMHIVDLSETQLALFRLRHAAIKNLDYDQYLYFLGYKNNGPSQIKRSDLIQKLNLQSQDQLLWKSHQKLWETDGFIYLGKWERHFMKVGSLFQKMTLTSLAPLFEAKDLKEQREILDKYWHPRLFHIYTKIVMNEWIANKLLYKGSYAGAKDNKTMQMSAADFVYNEFNDLFHNTWVRGNYFLNMIFLGRVSNHDCYPTECNEEIFNKIKLSQTQISFHKKNLLELLLTEAHDFYSLSDTFSYMKDEEVKDFLGKLPSTIKTNTKIVIRTFMRKPSFEILAPWSTNTQNNKDLAKKDCTRMYEMSVLTRG